MFDQLKAGHVLRFGICPTSILSPKGAKSSESNDNSLATPWPTTSALGLVQAFSHPSGHLGVIAGDVATKLRPGGSLARSASYSAAGRLLTASDRPVGSENCDFVGYVDGQANYIKSSKPVFSKDFSGCLFVNYIIDGKRYVAHAAASQVPKMDTKQAFLNTIKGMRATLVGWYKPFELLRDSPRKAAAFAHISQHVGGNINSLVTFGVMAGSRGYSVDAFKPVGTGGNDWVVTDVTEYPLSRSWNVAVP